MSSSWEKFKFTLSKVVFPWIKAHGKLVFGLVVLIIILILVAIDATGRKRLLKLISVLLDNHRKEIEEIDTAKKDQDAREKEALEAYNKKVEEIKKQYETSMGDLDKKKEKEIEKIVKQYNSNPEKMDRTLEDRLGIKRYES